MTIATIEHYSGFPTLNRLLGLPVASLIYKYSNKIDGKHGIARTSSYVADAFGQRGVREGVGALNNVIKATAELNQLSTLQTGFALFAQGIMTLLLADYRPPISEWAY